MFPLLWLSEIRIWDSLSVFVLQLGAKIYRMHRPEYLWPRYISRCSPCLPYLFLSFFLSSSSSSSSFHSLDLVVDLPPLFQKFENRKVERGKKEKKKKRKFLHNRLRARIRFINVYLGVVVTRRDSIRIKWNEERRREEFSRRRPTFRRIESDGRLSFFIGRIFFLFYGVELRKKSSAIRYRFRFFSLSLFSFPSPFFRFFFFFFFFFFFERRKKRDLRWPTKLSAIGLN